MNEERLSEKQEAFLNKHKVESKGITKNAATILIGDIIEGLKKNAEIEEEPYEVPKSEAFASDMYNKHARPVEFLGQKPKTNGNGFKLTEESIRSNALRCAIASIDEKAGGVTTEEFWSIVKDFEEYIRHGN